MSKIEQQVEAIATDICEKNGCVLWNVEFKKEGPDWHLRVFIHKDEGIGINDCEAVSHGLSEILDSKDIILQKYYLEVSSPGIERELKRDWHFKKYIGSDVEVKLYKAYNGNKKLLCRLVEYKDGTCVVVEHDGDNVAIELANISSAHIVHKW